MRQIRSKDGCDVEEEKTVGIAGHEAGQEGKGRVS